jgi:SAM-dependent methyltransferase
MKNTASWKSTKYEWKNGKFRASRDAGLVTISSRLMTDLSATLYEKYIPQYASGKLADLGCGMVPLYDFYKPHITENICIDWPNSLHQNQYLDVSCNLNESLPLPNNEFDSIILSEVLEHIAEPDQLWKEMTRILKPSGRILLGVPFLYKIHEAPHDYFRYTEFALRNFAFKNNLEVLELVPYGGLPAVLTDLYARQLSKIPLLGNWICGVSQDLCSWFIRTNFGKRISNTSAKHYPIGYFMVVQKPGSHV